MKNNFYELDKSEKAILFKETATQKGMMPFAVEKDWWVVRTLEIIFKQVQQHILCLKEEHYLVHLGILFIGFQKILI
ncbi:hypothetical protein [Flavobacterium sp. JP2137]|uniref:hypothetical protein n=1 Tax=Flavobacterium sp. JP2137 TaxID=3414510 RepID=UPI003D2FAE3B